MYGTDRMIGMAGKSCRFIVRIVVMSGLSLDKLFWNVIRIISNQNY